MIQNLGQMSTIKAGGRFGYPTIPDTQIHLQADQGKAKEPQWNLETNFAILWDLDIDPKESLLLGRPLKGSYFWFILFTP